MGWVELDTRVWNLGLLAAGVGGCGPLVPVPAETDGDESEDDDEPPTETSVDPTETATDTVGPGCGAGPPCPPGYSCFDGRCEYDCQSCCLGECGGYYECFSHDDCPDHAYCNYYSCQPLPYLYDCFPGVEIVEDLIPDVGGAIALAFLDSDDDGTDDLAVLGNSAAWVVRGPWAGETIPVDTFGGNTGFVVGSELDGASPTEITFSLYEAGLLLTVRVVDQPEPVAVNEPWLAWPVTGDFDADGLDDIAGLGEAALVYLFSDGMQYGAPNALRGAFGSTLAVGAVGPTPGEDIVYADGFVQAAEVGGGALGIQLEEDFPLSVRTPVVGDFDGNGTDDVAAIADRDGYYALLATWTQLGPGQLARLPYAVGPNLEPHPEGPYFAVAVGDFDADGSDDVVVGGENRLTVLFGAVGGGGGFACWAEIPIAGTARVVAAGNHDGVFGDDIAWSDGMTSTHVLVTN